MNEIEIKNLKNELVKKTIEITGLKEEINDLKRNQADVSRKAIRLLNILDIPFDKQIELISMFHKL